MPGAVVGASELAGCFDVFLNTSRFEGVSVAIMEAVAAGTPVVALRNGALAETVEHGRTGFLVDDAHAMPEAMVRAADLDPEDCRETARLRFSLDRMIVSYFAVYEQLAAMGRRSRFAGAA